MATVEEILIKVGVDVSQLDKISKRVDGVRANSKQLARAAALTNRMLKKQREELNKVAKATKPFRMELLSLGFGLQMINRGMSNLLQPAFEAAGIFDIFSTMLQIVFLPIALFLLDHVLMPMFDFFTNLPEPVQFVIGAFVALLAAVTAILAPIAFLGLFADSLAKGWVILGNILTPIFNAIKFFFTGVGALIAVVVIAVVGFYLAWKTNFGKIRDWVAVIWDGIKQIIEGAKKYLTGFKDILVGIFTLDWDKIKKGFSGLWDGIEDIFKGGLKVILGTLATMGLSLLKGILSMIPAFIRIPLAKWMGLDTGKEVAGPTNKRQSGGYIPYDGLYKLHAGETVNSSHQQLNFNPSININSTGGVIDLERIKQALNQQWQQELGRLARR